MNEYFSYPDKIRIDRAVFYKIAPIPLDVPFKDGTGNVRNASLFGSWMKIYDEDGVCGQGPCTPLMLNFFVPLLLKEEAKTVDGLERVFLLADTEFWISERTCQ